MRRIAEEAPTRLFSEPHASQQMIPANELVVHGRANVQGDEGNQEGPTQSVYGFPGNAAALEVLRYAADTEQLRKISALQ